MNFNVFTNIYTEKELLSYLSIEDNISNIKKELVGYNSNFFLNSEEITDEERLQITNLSVESLINCSNNLSIILSRFFIHKQRYNNKFSLIDNILFKDETNLENTNYDIKKMFNDIYTIEHYILKSLIDYYLYEIDYYKRNLDYLNTINNQINPLIKTGLINKYNKLIESFNTKYINLIQKFIYLLNFDIEYENYNLDTNPEFVLDKDIIYIILNALKFKEVISHFNTTINKLIYNIFVNTKIDNDLRLSALSLISTVENFNKAFYEININENRIGIEDLFSLVIYEYKKCVANPSVYEFFRNILLLQNLIIDFLSYHNLSNTKINFNDNIVNYIYAILDIYFQINKIDNVDIKIIQDKILQSIYNLIKNCNELIYTDIVKHIPYVFINSINNNEFNIDHTHILIDISYYLCQNKDYYYYIVNSCANIEKYIDILVGKDELYKYSMIFKKISETENNFMDMITCEFIINVALLPMNNGELQLCDKHTILSALRNKEIHPYTREQLTIEQFNKIQIDNKNKITELNLKKREFINSLK
jgi:hypothetical protein